MNITVNIPLITSRENVFNGFLRHYELKEGVSQSINGTYAYEALPEPDHYRATLMMEVSGVSVLEGEQVDVFQAYTTLEAICVIQADEALTAEMLKSLFVHSVGPHLLSQARVNLTSVSLMTGFQSIVLPPLDVSLLANLMGNSSEAE